jgi:hypothetical protein
VLGRWPEPGGDQEGAEFVAVQGGGMRLAVQPRPADVGGRGMVEEFLLDGVLAEPGDGAQSGGDGRASTAPGFEFTGEGLDVRTADGEQRQGPGAAPIGELAQVEGLSLAGQAAVPGQEPGEREPLGIGEHRLDRDERGRCSCGGHHGTSRDSRDLEGWAAGPSDERCPQRTTVAENELRHDL